MEIWEGRSTFKNISITVFLLLLFFLYRVAKKGGVFKNPSNIYDSVFFLQKQLNTFIDV